ARGAVQTALLVASQNPGTPHQHGCHFPQPVARDQLVEVGEGVPSVGGQILVEKADAGEPALLMIGPEAVCNAAPEAILVAAIVVEGWAEAVPHPGIYAGSDILAQASVDAGSDAGPEANAKPGLKAGGPEDGLDAGADAAPDPLRKAVPQAHLDTGPQ